MEQYRWDDVPHEEVSPMISRQVIHTPYMTLARITFKRGGIAPLHHHENDQVTTILSGKLQLEIEGEKAVFSPADVVRVPGDVPHAAQALEETVVMDVFTPARSDWQ